MWKDTSILTYLNCSEVAGVGMLHFSSSEFRGNNTVTTQRNRREPPIHGRKFACQRHKLDELCYVRGALQACQDVREGRGRTKERKCGRPHMRPLESGHCWLIDTRGARYILWSPGTELGQSRRNQRMYLAP